MSSLSSRGLAPRQFDDRVEPVAHPRLFGVLLTHALEPVELLVDREQHRVGQRLLRDLRAVLGDDVVVAVAQLLADLVELAAQQQLALLLVEIVGDVGADLVLQLEVGERLPHPREDQLEARLDVDRLEQLDALLHRQLGRVRGGVGQLTGIVDAGEHVGDAARAAVFEDRLDDGLVLARQLEGARGRRDLARTSSTWTCSAPCAPSSPVPTRPRLTPRITSARVPFGRSPALSIAAMVPTRANRPSTRGTSTIRSPASAAAAPARFASSVSSAMVTTICGSTTPWVRGNRGRSCVLVSDIVPV